MAQQHLKVGSEPDEDELRELIDRDVYVGGKMGADDRRCQRIWADYVKEQTGGRYVGRIFGYNNHMGFKGEHIVGPDLEDPNPSSGIDARMTWTLCVVDPKTDAIVGWESFLPQQRSIDDSEYEHTKDLAQAVIDGEMTLTQAKRSAQYYAEHVGSDELEDDIAAGFFDDTFPKG